MSKRKDVQPDVNEDRTAMDRPGGRHEFKGEEDARNKTTRRGER